MKKKDLKAGEFYAVKDGWQTQLALLLDVDSLYRFDWGRSSTSFKKSTADKPYRGHREATGYAIVIVSTDTPELREAAKAVTVDQLLAADGDLGKGLRGNVVTSLPAFLGQYDDVLEARKAQEEREKQVRERKAQAAEEARGRYAQLAARLTALGLSPAQAESWTRSHVDSVRLRFDDVEKLLAMADFVEQVRGIPSTMSHHDVSLTVADLLDVLYRKVNPSE